MNILCIGYHPFSHLCCKISLLWSGGEMMRKRRTHIGFDTILNVWYPGHGIVQRGDVCDDGFLIWVGHIHICKERGEKSFKNDLTFLILTVWSWRNTMHTRLNIPWVKCSGWCWICDSSHPLGPAVGWRPGLSLPRWRPAPDSPGWTVGTLSPCRSEWACGETERAVSGNGLLHCYYCQSRLSLTHVWQLNISARQILIKYLNICNFFHFFLPDSNNSLLMAAR